MSGSGRRPPRYKQVQTHSVTWAIQTKFSTSLALILRYNTESCALDERNKYHKTSNTHVQVGLNQRSRALKNWSYTARDASTSLPWWKGLLGGESKIYTLNLRPNLIPGKLFFYSCFPGARRFEPFSSSRNMAPRGTARNAWVTPRDNFFPGMAPCGITSSHALDIGTPLTWSFTIFFPRRFWGVSQPFPATSLILVVFSRNAR